MLRISSLGLFALSLLTACSVWQNASRKYMEKQSYDYAGLKLQEQNFLGCGHAEPSAPWSAGPADDRARLYVRDLVAKFELRVEPAQEGAMACDYAFASAEERREATDAAIQHALDQFDAP